MEIALGRVRLTIPDALEPGRGHAIDSATAVFEGAGISVLVDQGPLVDRLDAYADRPAYEASEIIVDGRVGRLITYTDGDAAAVTAGVHVGGATPVTVVVRAPDAPSARRIVDSLQLV